jgi:hypothetical protein
MKEQRWPGDNEDTYQEFKKSWEEEARGMKADNMSHGNDYLAMGTSRQLDAYDRGELEPSWCQQLDTVGMQPHAREYLERDIHAMRSGRKFTMVAGEVIDHCDGIQFSGSP